MVVARSTRRATTIMVQVIDLAAFETKALEFAKANGYPTATRCGAEFSPLGFVDTPIGMFVLSSEGIGSSDPITDKHSFEMDFFARNKKGGWILPVCEGAFTPSQLRAAATGERVNLADFIRVFGARGEGSYKMWLNHLEKAQGQEGAQ